MKLFNRPYSRKEFLKKSSRAAMAAGVLSFVPSGLFAASRPKSFGGSLSTSMLGSTGITATKLGIGAPRIQEPSVLRYALDQGITFIDTGRRYANGKNEEMVGEVIKGRRKDFVIQSKVNLHYEKEGSDNETLASKISAQFTKSLEESFKALGTDHIDIMLFHGASKIEEVYNDAVKGVFEKAKKEGKIRASGYSTHTGLVLLITHQNKDPFYDVIMPSFNPFGGYTRRGTIRSWDQETLIAEMKKASDAGTGIVAMKTCMGGPYCFEGDDKESYPGAVKWVLEKPYIHSSAVAMASFQQLDEHLAVHKG